jgi:hypothetical protein
MRMMLLQEDECGLARPHYWTQGPFLKKRLQGCAADVLVAFTKTIYQDQDLTDAK